LIDLLDDNPNLSWSWANFLVDEESQANVIAFSSGWGDVLYPTYFGYDVEDCIVKVITDFRLLP
jgi:hypothetical protein